jgi:hypothetical protein
MKRDICIARNHLCLHESQPYACYEALLHKILSARHQPQWGAASEHARRFEAADVSGLESHGRGDEVRGNGV